MSTIKYNPVEKNVIDGIAENWKFLSEQLQAKYPQLTSKDLEFETNKEEELLLKIELRLSKNREEVISIIEKIQLEDFLIRTEV
jgi:hypothetical protein